MSKQDICNYVDGSFVNYVRSYIALPDCQPDFAPVLYTSHRKPYMHTVNARGKPYCFLNNQQVLTSSIVGTLLSASALLY